MQRESMKYSSRISQIIVYPEDPNVRDCWMNSYFLQKGKLEKSSVPIWDEAELSRESEHMQKFATSSPTYFINFALLVKKCILFLLI